MTFQLSIILDQNLGEKNDKYKIRIFKPSIMTFPKAYFVFLLLLFVLLAVAAALYWWSPVWVQQLLLFYGAVWVGYLYLKHGGMWLVNKK